MALARIYQREDIPLQIRPNRANMEVIASAEKMDRFAFAYFKFTVGKNLYIFGINRKDVLRIKKTLRAVK